MSFQKPTDEQVDHMAWLMWCYQQGYIMEEDRKIVEPSWIGDDEATLHPDDVRVRNGLRSMARDILGAFAKEVIEPSTGAINILFDGPPSYETGRFVEVEDDNGNSISVGKWFEKGDGYWALRIPAPAAEQPSTASWPPIADLHLDEIPAVTAREWAEQMDRSKDAAAKGAIDPMIVGTQRKDEPTKSDTAAERPISLGHECGGFGGSLSAPAPEDEREALARIVEYAHRTGPVSVGEPSMARESADLILAAGWISPAEVAALVASTRGQIVEGLGRDWRLFREHHPVGAYLPVGQLDGDCSCGRGAWPCETLAASIARAAAKGDGH